MAGVMTEAFIVLQDNGPPELVLRPDLFYFAAAGILLFLLVAGFVIWRVIFATSQTDFGQEFRKSASTGKSMPTAPPQKELDAKAVSKSAETVSNKEDDAVVDELRGRFSSQQTVDAMGDQSVSTDDDDSEGDG